MRMFVKCLFCVLLSGSLGLFGQPLVEPAPPEAPAPPAPPRVMVAAASGTSYLGVGLGEIDTDRAKALNLKEERGAEITSVEPDSPAEKGGLKRGDVVLEFNGVRIEGTEQFARMVRETPSGRQVKLLISRGGSTLTVTPTVGSRKSRMLYDRGTGRRWDIPMPDIQVHIPDVPRAFMSWRSSTLGVEAESLEGALAEYFGVKEGVLVRSVVKGSPAEKAGLKAGDVITRVDSTKVATPREISSAIRSLRGKSFPVTVMRDRKETKVTVALEDERGGERRREQDPRVQTL